MCIRDRVFTTLRNRITSGHCRLFILAAIAALPQIACEMRSDPGSLEQTVRTNDLRTVTIYLSNQSYRKPWTTVRLQLDGKAVARQRLFVGGQHLRKQCVLKVPSGNHTFVVSSTGNAVSVTNTFTLNTSNVWISVNHWYGQQDQRPYFTSQIQHFPFAFD